MGRCILGVVTLVVDTDLGVDISLVGTVFVVGIDLKEDIDLVDIDLELEVDTILVGIITASILAISNLKLLKDNRVKVVKDILVIKHMMVNRLAIKDKATSIPKRATNLR